MKSRIPALLVAVLLTVASVEARGQPTSEGATQRKIAFAKARVYPALVNISVVTRLYRGGQPSRTAGSGSGVIVSASVIDNTTNDGTSVVMKR